MVKGKKNNKTHHFIQCALNLLLLISVPATGLSMNTYSAELSGSLNTCAYSSANETNTSDEDSTSSYDIPYTADFQTKSIFEQFSVIDSNHDNYSWQYDEGFHAAVYPYSENAGDDGLVSPAIRLKAGHLYTFNPHCRYISCN